MRRDRDGLAGVDPGSLRAARPRRRSRALAAAPHRRPAPRTFPIASWSGRRQIDLGHLAAYSEVCGFRLRDELPPTYPHILAFPLQMALMTDRRFPFPAVGLVHIPTGSPSTGRSRSARSSRFAVRASKLESHPKGRQFSLLPRPGSARSWFGRRPSTNLRRGEGSAESPGPSRSSEPRSARKLADRRPVEARRRPRAPLRRRLRRSKPDPHARLERQGVRVPAGDRARDVVEGPMPGCARGQVARRLHYRGRLQAADPAACQGRFPDSGRRQRRELRPPVPA